MKKSPLNKVLLQGFIGSKPSEVSYNGYKAVQLNLHESPNEIDPSRGSDKPEDPKSKNKITLNVKQISENKSDSNFCIITIPEDIFNRNKSSLEVGSHIYLEGATITTCVTKSENRLRFETIIVAKSISNLSHLPLQEFPITQPISVPV